ncbi:MAG: type II toxin-antitoxin system VapC family toxin [Fimbriimonadales bacterium]|nr:type II toxin-antitoxin system VapC family toxin [Fimbriimonadales bacterium]
MSGSKIALDTNIAIDVLNGEPRANRLLQGYTTVCLPVPVVGELHFGALKSARREENLEKLRLLTTLCEILEISERTAVCYAEIRYQLRQKGRPIPENDLWIAAVCVEHQIPLATNDAHFTSVDGLTIVQV